jgi:hypothetical protein
MTNTLIFSECEHQGDIENYQSDIIKSGGKILDSEFDHINETVTIIIEYEEDDFLEKFINTNAFQFSNLNYY